MKDLKEYKVKLDKLHRLGSELRQVALVEEDDSIDRHIQKIQYWIKEHDLLIATVGEVSVGKSTFMNSILREDVLPTAVKESTALVTYVKRGEKKRATFYLDGKKMHESDDIASFNEHYIVKPKAKKESAFSLLIPKEFKKLKDGSSEKEARIVIEIDNPLLQNQVQIIDTPGLNDAQGIRSLITKRFITKADAVIVLLRADKLLSQSEIEFFTSHILKKHLHHIFVLINRIDHLKTSEEAIKVKKEAVKKLTGFGILEHNIHFVSAKQAVLAERLDYYLSHPSEDFLQDIPSISIRKMIEPYQDNLSVMVEKTQKHAKELKQISGIPAFFEELESYLVNQKGEARIYKIKHEFQKVAQELNDLLQEELINLSLNEIEITQKHEQLVSEVEHVETAMHKSRETLKDILLVNTRLFLEKFDEEFNKNQAFYINEINSTSSFTSEGQAERMLKRITGELGLMMEEWTREAFPAFEEQTKKKYIEELQEYVSKSFDEKKLIHMDSVFGNVEKSFEHVKESGISSEVAAIGGGLTGIGLAATIGAGVIGAAILAPLAAISAVFLLGGRRESSSGQLKSVVRDEFQKASLKISSLMKREISNALEASFNQLGTSVQRKMRRKITILKKQIDVSMLQTVEVKEVSLEKKILIEERMKVLERIKNSLHEEVD